MENEELAYIKQIFDYFGYHNKNLTKKQWLLLVDLRILVGRLQDEATKDDY